MGKTYIVFLIHSNVLHFFDFLIIQIGCQLQG